VYTISGKKCASVYSAPAVILCFVCTLFSPTFAIAGSAIGVCRPLKELSRSMLKCQDNRKLLDAAQECQNRILAQADSLSASMAAAMRLSAEKSKDGGAKDLFENHEKNLLGLQATLTSLIATATKARAEVAEYDSQLIWPVEVSASVAHSSQLSDYLSAKGACYGDNHKGLNLIISFLEKKLMQLNSLKISAGVKEKTTSGYDHGLLSESTTAPLAQGTSAENRFKGGHDQPGKSDVTGRADRSRLSSTSGRKVEKSATASAGPAPASSSGVTAESSITASAAANAAAGSAFTGEIKAGAGNSPEAWKGGPFNKPINETEIAGASANQADPSAEPGQMPEGAKNVVGGAGVENSSLVKELIGESEKFIKTAAAINGEEVRHPASTPASAPASATDAASPAPIRENPDQAELVPIQESPTLFAIVHRKIVQKTKEQGL
jgi:hypothetical protein